MAGPCGSNPSSKAVSIRIFSATEATPVSWMTRDLASVFTGDATEFGERSVRERQLLSYWHRRPWLFRHGALVRALVGRAGRWGVSSCPCRRPVLPLDVGSQPWR